MTALSGFNFYVAVVNLPQRFQIVDLDGPVIAGVKLLPMMVSSAVGSLTAGAINTKRNLTPYTLITSSAVQVLGYALMTTLGDASPTPQRQFGFQVFLGLGIGLAMPTVTIMAQLHAEPKWTGESLLLFDETGDSRESDNAHSGLPRSTHPDEISWRQYRSCNRRRCLQQQDQSFDCSCFRAQPGSVGCFVQVTTCDSKVHTATAGIGVKGICHGIHGGNARYDVHRRCMLFRQPSGMAKASSTGRNATRSFDGSGRRRRRVESVDWKLPLN